MGKPKTKEPDIPRKPRQISPTGIYHVMFRGVSRCHIFEDTEDYLRMLHILGVVKTELDVKLLAYCLMDNHAHLMLLEDEPGRLPLFMQKVLVSYVGRFNRRHDRCGTLVESRYKSECVASERYALALIRYIHLNPLVAGVANTVADYAWSSFKDYMGTSSPLADTSTALAILSPDEVQARDLFADLHSVGQLVEMHAREHKRPTEEQLRLSMTEALHGWRGGDEAPALSDIVSLDKRTRNEALGVLRAHGFSIRQLERATGVSRGIVANCHKR
ncbi:MAG: transposase [Coriobacteriales bacterium]|jgi:REP element-mobilizing transposase RayT|nr:transposase [Coriobacteriales bacterium]